MFKNLLTRQRVDGVVDAAHFGPAGELLWVRAYERRGPTWSDRVLLDRQTLIDRLKDGKRFFIGKRKEFRASEFELGEAIRFRETRRGAVLLVGKGRAAGDRLGGLPRV